MPIGTIWNWFLIRVGMANTIFLLVIFPVTVWIVIHNYLLAQGVQQNQEQFNEFIQRFEESRSTSATEQEMFESYRTTIIGITTTMAAMNKNIEAMTVAIQKEQQRPINVNIPRQAAPRVAIRPTVACPKMIEARKFQNMGGAWVVITEMIPNPNLKSCLEAQRRARR